MGTSPPTPATTTPQPSLEVALCYILDSLANNDDSFFPTAVNPTDLKLPGKRTTQLQALEGALRGLVTRVQDLETRHSSSSSSSSSPIDMTPTPKQLATIKQDERRLSVNGKVCDTCGHRLENGPLTPDETPPVVDNGVSHVPKRIPSSATTSCDGAGVDV